MKLGRNTPCPCGSGKKYKACCLRRHLEIRRNSERSGSVAIADMHIEDDIERQRRSQFGKQRPVLHASVGDVQMVAVGDEVHYSSRFQTFPDFLSYYIKILLTQEWAGSELAKKPSERHPITQWYVSMCHLQEESKRKNGSARSLREEIVPTAAPQRSKLMRNAVFLNAAQLTRIISPSGRSCCWGYSSPSASSGCGFRP